MILISAIIVAFVGAAITYLIRYRGFQMIEQTIEGNVVAKKYGVDPKVYGKDIATFGSGIEKKQIKTIFPKGKK